jgi:hypothetical protein
MREEVGNQGQKEKHKDPRDINLNLDRLQNSACTYVYFEEDFGVRCRIDTQEKLDRTYREELES